MMEHDYRKLKVWMQAHQWVLSVYEVSRKFPKDECYGLTSQLRRAAVSVPTNLAEGCGRRSAKDISHFIQIALGSCNESEYLLTLAKDLGYLKLESANDLIEIINSVSRQLRAFQSRVEKDS